MTMSATHATEATSPMRGLLPLWVGAGVYALFILASQLFPPEFPDDMDFARYYFANNRWFFGLLVLALLIDIPETLWKGVAHLRDVPPQYAYFLPTLLLIAILSALSKSRRVHAVLCLCWLAMNAGYFTLTALEKAVAV